MTDEEKARQEAEARRQKILEKANNRMDLVNGIKSSDDGEEETEKPKTSSKLAAMRRRRFKKGGAAPPKKEETETPVATAVSEEKTAPITETTPVPVETTAAEESEPVEEEKPAAEPAPVEPAPIVKEESTEEPTDQPVPDAAPKKKYMGVAKMRRKMNKERQAKEEEERAKDAADSNSATAKLMKEAVKKRSVGVSKLPILMHVVTVFLLFFAGLDIGLQQHKLEYSMADVTVHKELAPQQELRLLTKIANFGSGSSKTTTKPKGVLDKMVEDSSVYEAVEDEFDTNDDAAVEENIDPLFQVDLDKYTQGSGIFMMAGRFAVACHRLNLYFFYYLPLSIVARIQNTILSLFQSPPMLCILALAIRQAIGNVVLGARLPEAVEDESQHKDVLSMAKNFVKSFVLRSFPTATTIYDAWVHLRADMYVILCGLFVGIAWHHHFSDVFLRSSQPQDGSADEL